MRGESGQFGRRTLVPKGYFGDFSPDADAEYGDVLVTAAEIKALAADFRPQPMHLDEEAAKHTLVGGLCASGWHTCCIMMRLVADNMLNRVASLGAPGVDEGRWM